MPNDKLIKDDLDEEAKKREHIERIKQDFSEIKEDVINNIPTFKQNPNKEIKTFTPKKVEKKFLDTRRILFFGIMILICVILIIVTLIEVTNVNINSVIQTMHKISTHEGGLIAGYVLLLILGSIVRLIWQIETIRMRTKVYLIRIRFREWLNFGIITIFINTITIFALGSDPYKMWWLCKKGLNLTQANAIILSTGWIIQLTQMLISYPSLGFLIYLYFFTNGEFTHSVQTNSAMALVAVGYTNDVVVFISLTILGFSMRLQYLIVVIFNWVRKILGMSYKSKEVLKQEFIEKSKFQKLFTQQISNIEADFYVVLWTVGSLLFYYFSMYFAWELVVPYSPIEELKSASDSMWDLYNFANVATVANNFIPVPGGEGSLQFVIIAFSESIFKQHGLYIPNNSLTLKSAIHQTVFVWRLFNYYLLIIFGTFYCICLGIYRLRILKIQRRFKEETKKKSWFEKI